jgi:hypothetical protein
MSMTQVAFFKKEDQITKAEIQSHLSSLGYDFDIVDDFDKLDDIQGGLSCKINGHACFFETYFNPASEIIAVYNWIEPDLSGQDTAISFVWGADFTAGACIGLISIALIDKCNALIYYLDDEMKYTREMLVADTPEFLKAMEKHNPNRK